MAKNNSTNGMGKNAYPSMSEGQNKNKTTNKMSDKTSNASKNKTSNSEASDNNKY